jgi:hypothetical protein
MVVSLYRRSRAWVSHAAKNALGYDKVMAQQWARGNPFVGTEAEWRRTFRAVEPTVGILSDVAHRHRWYLHACHDLGVNYLVVDPRGDDWYQQLSAAEVATVFVWPTIAAPSEKAMWDERVRLLADVAGLQVYPDAMSLWLYEGKGRIAEWLRIHGYPQVVTHVFHDRDHALSFVQGAGLPLVYKTDQGAAASGVRVIRSRGEGRRLVRAAFGPGVRLIGRNHHVRHRGSVLFQEFVDVKAEWRLIRVGDAYFCKQKAVVGEFFSGSGAIDWAAPPPALLEATAQLTERHGFRCLNVDWFETSDGAFFINELHALWGNKPLGASPHKGRHIRDGAGAWSFEPGVFDSNQFCNLRVLDALLGRPGWDRLGAVWDA